MKLLVKFTILLSLMISGLSLSAQFSFINGASFPIVQRSTFSNTTPCSVCTPWQFVQADSTLRRYIDGSWVTYYDPNSSGGTINLSTASDGTTFTIVNSNGDNATITAATGSLAGIMVATDKAKLNNIAVTQAVDLDALESDVTDLTTLSGVASNAVNFGTFAGATITDNLALKPILQELELAVEASSGTDLSVSLTATNATIVSSTGNNATIPAAQVSAAGVMSAADKTKLDGLAGYSSQTITSGNLTVIVDRYGTDPVTFTVNATGDYTLVIPATTRVDNIFIHGDNTTLTGGSFIFRIDNNANGNYERMITQLYNTASGGLVDVFSQGNNHTRGVSGNIVSDTFPNMSPYGGTGFDILYR